jgi:hypothetical protein
LYGCHWIDNDRRSLFGLRVDTKTKMDDNRNMEEIEK